VEGRIRRPDYPPAASHGYIYRGKRLVNWDPVLHTALSDLEVLSEEEQGHLWHLRYPLSDGSGQLIVATTRPETMLGDTAVAVHPEDERYQKLIGKTITLPLTGREIPVIADDYVDPEFGSGCVKITPAHDFNDYAMGQRHQLEIINIFNDNAEINDNAPDAYRGMDRYVARKQIVKDLQALDLLEQIDDHKLMVPRGDRSNAVVEPYLTDQWYVDLTTETQEDGRPGGKKLITTPSIEAVKNGSIKQKLTTSGSITLKTGVSVDKYGGDTAYPPGTTTMARSTLHKQKVSCVKNINWPMTCHCIRTKTYSTPGFHLACGLSLHLAGRNKPMR